jgi:hypothetical protein
MLIFQDLSPTEIGSFVDTKLNHNAVLPKIRLHFYSCLIQIFWIFSPTKALKPKIAGLIFESTYHNNAYAIFSIAVYVDLQTPGPGLHSLTVITADTGL